MLPTPSPTPSPRLSRRPTLPWLKPSTIRTSSSPTLTANDGTLAIPLASDSTAAGAGGAASSPRRHSFAATSTSPKEGLGGFGTAITDDRFRSWGRQSITSSSTHLAPQPPPSGRSTPTSRLRALSQSAPRPSSLQNGVNGLGIVVPAPSTSSDPYQEWQKRRNSSLRKSGSDQVEEFKLELPTPPPTTTRQTRPDSFIEMEDLDSPTDRLPEPSSFFPREIPPKPTSPLPPLPIETNLPLSLSLSQPPSLPSLGEESPPQRYETSNPRTLSAAAVAALADTPPRRSLPLKSRSRAPSLGRTPSISKRTSSLPPSPAASPAAINVDNPFNTTSSRNRSISVSSSSTPSSIPAPTTTTTTTTALSPTTPILGLSHPRPRENHPDRTPSLSYAGSASSRASSSVFTPSASGGGGGMVRGSRGSHYFDGEMGSEDWSMSQSASASEWGEGGGGVKDGGGEEVVGVGEEGEKKGGSLRRRRGLGSLKGGRRPSVAAMRIETPTNSVVSSSLTPQDGLGLGLGLGIEAWGVSGVGGEGLAPLGSPTTTMGLGLSPSFADVEDLQRGLDELARYAKSLPSPVPPLWTGGGGLEEEEIPPLPIRSGREREASGATMSSEGSSLFSQQQQLGKKVSRPTLLGQQQQRSSDESTSYHSIIGGSPSLSPDPNNNNTSNAQSRRPSFRSGSLTPWTTLGGQESDAYLSVDESGLEDFLSDEDGDTGGEVARRFRPFGLEQEEEQKMEVEEEVKRGLVDWTGERITGLVVPGDTTHLILARSATPQLVPLLLRKIVPTLDIGLVVLDLSNCSLTALPSALALCPTLEELDIRSNPLTSPTLPPFLATLPALRVLIADSCGLVELPSALSQLTRLQTLSVRENRLRSLPGWLARLKGLEVLLVDGNPFHSQWSKVVTPILLHPPSASSSPPVLSPASPQFTPSTFSAPSPVELPPNLAPSSRSSKDLKKKKSSSSLRSALSGKLPGASTASLNNADSLPPSPNHSMSTPPPASAEHVSLAEAQARLRHHSENPLTQSVPSSGSSTPLNIAGSGDLSSSKKWGSKMFKKVSRMRSGSSSTRPGALGVETGRSSSQPFTTGEASFAESKLGGGGGGTPFKSRVLNRSLNKKPKALALQQQEQEQQQKLQKRGSFLRLDADGRVGSTIFDYNGVATSPVDSFALGSSVSTLPNQPISPVMDHQAGLRSVMAYLRDLDDLSLDLVSLPPIPLDSPSPSVGSTSSPSPSIILRHSPSLGSISPSSSPAAGLGIRRAQSTRRLPIRQVSSTSTTTNASSRDSGRFSQFLSGDVEVDNNGGRTTPLPSTSTDEEKTIKLKDDPIRRQKVIEEIIETEKSYLKGLQEVCGIYIAAGAMSVNGSGGGGNVSGGGGGGKKDSVLPATERRAVFGNIEAIRDFHEKIFLPDLLVAASTSSTTTVGLGEEEPVSAAMEVAKVFIRHAAFLKIYSSYVNGFDAALARIQTWSADSSSRPGTGHGTSPSPQIGSNSHPSMYYDSSASIVSNLSTSQKKRIKSYLKRCRAHRLHSQISLESYLLLPVQRVPRYRMLLESLVACTPLLSPSPDNLSPNLSTSSSSTGLEPHPVLTEALEMLADVANNLNERKRETEGRAQLLYWQSRIAAKFRSPLVQPHRSLLRSSSLLLVRTVKRSSTYLDTRATTRGTSFLSGPGGDPEVVHTLLDEMLSQNLIALLCTDLLVLVKEPANPADMQSSVDLYTVVRLNSAGNNKTPPASIFGDHMIRIVADSRAVLYVQCTRRSEATSWINAINAQWSLNT